MGIFKDFVSRFSRNGHVPSSINKGLKTKAAGYKAARGSLNRLTGHTSGVLAPHYALYDQLTRERITANVQALERNNSIASAALSNSDTNIVNVGLTLQSNLNAKSLGISEKLAREKENEINEMFDTWASSFEADATRQQTFYQMQSTVVYEWLGGGDCFSIINNFQRPGSNFGVKVRLVEGARISNPSNMPNTTNLRDGVELSPRGEPIFYHIQESHPGDFSTVGIRFKWRKFRIFDTLGRRRVCHIFKKKWVNQFRGETIFTAIVDELKKISVLDENELSTRMVQSLFGVFITSPHGDSELGPSDTWESDAETKAPISDIDKINLEPGLVQELGEGEDVRMIDPNRSGQNYKDFLDAITVRASAATGIPQEVLFQKFTSSFSAARAAILAAWEFYKVRRSLITDCFCLPVFKLVLDDRVARGFLDLPNYLEKRELWNRAIFRGTEMTPIDDLKAAKAAQVKLQAKISSRTHETRKATNLPFEKIQAEIDRERAMEGERARSQ